MNAKLIFLDIDGTITMPGTPPGPEIVGAIRAVQRNGHPFLHTRSVYHLRSRYHTLRVYHPFREERISL